MWGGEGEMLCLCKPALPSKSNVKVVQPVGGVMLMKTGSVELILSLSLDMDLNESEQRLNILDCLRENATNMRIEQQRIRDRISAAIVQARINLYQIRKLNDELNQMKESVGNALILSEPDHDRYLNEVEHRCVVHQINSKQSVKVDQESNTDDDVTNWSSIEKELLAQHPELQ